MGKLPKTIVLTLTSLLVFSMLNNDSLAVQGIRDVENDPISINNDLNYGSNSEYKVDYLKKFSPYAQRNASLRGGVSQLISIVGKSQLIRFDEPVKRLSIADPKLADVVMLSKKELLLNGKSNGETSLIIWGEKGDPVFFDLTVKNDTTALLEALKDIAPEEEIDIKFTANATKGAAGESAANAVFSGKISSTIKKEKIKSLVTAYGFNFVDLAESPTPQVMLEIKVAEANRSLTKNHTVDVTSGGKFLNPLNTQFKSPLKYLEISNNVGVVAPGVRLSNIYLPILNTTNSITLTETKGMIKILAEPKLVAVNKQEASFNAGQQVPVPSGIDPMTGQINYEYKDVGVNLKFTPDILEESGKILLKLNPEVNEIDTTITVRQPNGIVIYGIRTRKVNTTVELNDGETLVIAGLLQRSNSETSNHPPFIADIPILGQLFTSKEFRKGETELMIFVTPRILKSDNLVNGV
ncbi:MAG: hypothetical protein ACD_20C00328G0023 [uncultured bacterium]|nr:MAG: hypothetical protein ACD_20C00328G0023 [uncultured bacterium]HBH18035.1 hypothetical protein [Cyanobacteria bacterium UBA9579]